MVSLPNWFPRFFEERVDFTETRTLVFGLVQVGVAALVFYLLFFVLVGTHLVTRPMLDAEPSSKGLTLLLGFVPAVVLGAVVPVLVQRRAYFSRLNTRFDVRFVGQTLTFGTYVGFFFYHPVASVVYAFTYLSSRVVAIAGIYGGARLKEMFA